MAESQAIRRTVSAGMVPPHSSSPAGAPSRPARVSRLARMINGRPRAAASALRPARATGAPADLDQRVVRPLAGRPLVAFNRLHEGLHPGPQHGRRLGDELALEPDPAIGCLVAPVVTPPVRSVGVR